MNDNNQWLVVELNELAWPTSLSVPSPRFRLFVAAHTADVPIGIISDFANSALAAGAVYVCVWGKGCERFHDILDECITVDDLGAHKFAGPSANDTVMTTWHDDDSLEEALDFFATCAVPTDGFSEGSGFRLVVCVGRPDWAATARHFLEAAEFFV